MRSLFFLVLLGVLIPASFAGVEYAMLIWGWTTFMSPASYLYGIGATFEYGKIFAIISIILFFFSGNATKIRFNGMTLAFVIFAAHVSISTLLSDSDPEIVNDIWFRLMKVLAFAALIPYVFDTHARIHALVLIMVMGLGFHGVDEGLKFLATGGSHHIFGPMKSSFRDNNHFAAAMLMTFPFAIYAARHSDVKAIRYGFSVAAFLILVAVIGTFSRGGMVGLGAIGIWFLLSQRKKFAGLVSSIIVTITLFSVAPDEWFDRADTLSTTSEDGSFMGRVTAWKVSTVAAMDNPIFGTGSHGIQSQNIWFTYAADVHKLDFIDSAPIDPYNPRAAHSIYFEILGDLGFVGLMLFLGMGAYCWSLLRDLKKQTKDLPEFKWMFDLAIAIQGSLVAFYVSGGAVSIAYFDLLYVLFGLAFVLQLHMKQQSEPPFAKPELSLH